MSPFRFLVIPQDDIAGQVSQVVFCFMAERSSFYLCKTQIWNESQNNVTSRGY